MSFQDPDDRQRSEERAAALRKVCLDTGGHKYYPSDANGDSCRVCGARDPDPKPRVVLTAENYRAVHDPKNKKVVIERRLTDAVGDPKWEVMENIYSYGWPFYLLLTRGVRP